MKKKNTRRANGGTKPARVSASDQNAAPNAGGVSALGQSIGLIQAEGVALDEEAMGKIRQIDVQATQARLALANAFLGALGMANEVSRLDNAFRTAIQEAAKGKGLDLENKSWTFNFQKGTFTPATPPITSPTQQ